MQVGIQIHPVEKALYRTVVRRNLLARARGVLIDILDARAACDVARGELAGKLSVGKRRSVSGFN